MGQIWRNRKSNCDCHTFIYPSNSVFSFTPYQFLTMPSPSTDTMEQLLVIVSHSPASADRKGKCLFVPLPASRPSLHPSMTSFLLSLSLTPSLPPLSVLRPVSLSLPISTANFSCVVYRHVSAWLNSVLGHDSTLEPSFLCVISVFSACFFLHLKEGLFMHTHLYVNMHAHMHIGAAFVCMRSP